METSNLHVLFSQPIRGGRFDLDPLLVPDDSAYRIINFIRDGSTIRSRDGIVQAYTIQDQSPSRVSAIFRVANEDVGPMLIAVTDRGIHKYDEATDTFLSLMPQGVALNGVQTRKPQARVFFKETGSHLIVVNGSDVPKVLPPGATVVRDLLGQPPATASAIAVSANRVLLAEGAFIYVSAFNDCDAGYQSEQIVNLADTPGRILCMLERGNLTTMIFKEDAIYECTASGGAAPFQFGLRIGNVIGPASGHCVVPVPDGSYLYLGIDAAIYQFDGVNVQPVALPARVALSGLADRPNMFKSFGYWDPVLNAAVFFVPDAFDGMCKNGVVITYPDLAVFQISFPSGVTSGGTLFVPQSPIWEDYDIPWGPQATWDQIQADVYRTLLGANAGVIYRMEAGMDFGTTPVEAIIETKALPLGQNAPFVTVHGAEVLASGGPGTVNLELYSTDYGEVHKLSDSGSVDITSVSPIRVGMRASCRTGYLRVAARCNNPVYYRGAALIISQRGQR